MLQGKWLQNMTAQNLGLACSGCGLLWIEVSEPSQLFSAAQDLAWRMQKALSEHGVFLDVTLPRAKGRERSLVDFGGAQATRRQSPDTQSLGVQLPNCGLESGLGIVQVVSKDLFFSTRIHLVKTCQAASSKAPLIL